MTYLTVTAPPTPTTDATTQAGYQAWQVYLAYVRLMDDRERGDDMKSFQDRQVAASEAMAEPPPVSAESVTEATMLELIKLVTAKP